MGLFDKINSVVVKRIQESPGRYGGQLAYKFSQMVPPVSEMIALSKRTTNGICQALSEMWIVCHCNDGSLWNWLYPNNKLNTSALANMAYNFNYGSSNGVAITNQDENSDKFFLQYGIRRRTNMVMSKSSSNMFIGNQTVRVTQTTGTLGLKEKPRGDRSRMGQGKRLADKLVGGSMALNVGLGDGTYRMIGIRGLVGGHTMCAYVGADVCFFDPNFGEFHFPDRPSFAKWFAEFFWPKSFYDWILSNVFELRDYQRAVGAGPDFIRGKF
jgi:YopT peptidase